MPRARTYTDARRRNARHTQRGAAHTTRTTPTTTPQQPPPSSSSCVHAQQRVACGCHVSTPITHKHVKRSQCPDARGARPAHTNATATNTPTTDADGRDNAACVCRHNSTPHTSLPRLNSHRAHAHTKARTHHTHPAVSSAEEVRGRPQRRRKPTPLLSNTTQQNLTNNDDHILASHTHTQTHTHTRTLKCTHAQPLWR
jgi:hypothetical protein